MRRPGSTVLLAPTRAPVSRIGPPWCSNRFSERPRKSSLVKVTSGAMKQSSPMVVIAVM